MGHTGWSLRTAGKKTSLRKSGTFGQRRLRVERLEDRQLLSVAVGGTAWQEINTNGIQDAGESGLAGVAVEIYSSTDSVIGNADDVSHGQAITDASGHYAFPTLADGLSYYEVFRTPVGYTFAPQAAGSDRTVDSDPNASGKTALFTIAAGQTDTSRDAGLVGAAPDFGWALKTDGPIVVFGGTTTQDSAGNVYVAAAFEGDVDFDAGPGTYSLSTGNFAEAYVAKYTSAGALVWARSLGRAAYGLGDQSWGRQIAVASDGSVYTIGDFRGTADFDPGPGAFNLVTVGDFSPFGSGGFDAFIWKLDASGNFVWARSLGATGDDRGTDLAVGADGSVYATGFFNGTVDCDPGPDTSYLTSDGGFDAFALKLDASGNFVWARSFGGPSNDYGRGIALASDGSIYTSDSHAIRKLDAAGNLVWNRSLDGASADFSSSIAVAQDGSVYTSGYFSGTTDFDPGPGDSSLTSNGQRDAFVWKLDPSGTFAWARGLGGTSNDYAAGVAVAFDGSVYSTGYFQGTADFDPGPNDYSLTSAGNYDVFVWKLDASGNFVLARSMGGTNYDFGSGIAVDANGSVYISGEFSGAPDFDPGVNTYTLAVTSVFEGFLWKLNANQPPEDLVFSAANVAENQPAGTVVGDLSSADADLPGDSFTYTLVPGTGSDGNASFRIVGNQLQAAASFDYETQNVYSVRIRTTDQSGLWFEKSFVIGIADVADAPPSARLISAPNINTMNGAPYTFTVQYSGDCPISVPSLDSSDIRVTGPNGFSQSAILVSVDNAADGTPRSATYRIAPPGGMWSPTANAVYTILMVADQVTDGVGNSVAAGSLGTFAVNTLPDRIRPRATLTALPVNTLGGTSYTFTVTYTDNVAIKAATLDNSDIEVTGPRGYRQLARLVSVSPGGNGTPRTATYRITPPRGAWSAANNGAYTVKLRSRQVTDTSGNALDSGKFGTFVVDTIGPETDVTARRLTKRGLANYTFTVTYTDKASIDVATFDDLDLRVVGPNGYDCSAVFVGVETSRDATRRKATYRIASPGAAWTSADNGTYAIVMQPGQVLDAFGNAVAGGTLDTFKISAPRSQCSAAAIPARATAAASGVDHVFGLLGSSPGIDSAGIWASWATNLKRSKRLAG